MLQGRAVSLRALERDDMGTLAKWVNDPLLARWLGPRFPVSLQEQDIWFDKLVQDQSKKRLLIEDDEGTAIGLASLMQIDWRNRRAELGVYIGEQIHLGKGHGSDAVLTLLRFAFQELGLYRVYLYVFEDNARAIRCFERCGFREEGLLRCAAYYQGEFHNVLVMGILAPELDGGAER